ncbi:unnamed protein product [Parajaminaea phylloscopi]
MLRQIVDSSLNTSDWLFSRICATIARCSPTQPGVHQPQRSAKRFGAWRHSSKEPASVGIEERFGSHDKGLGNFKDARV